jgi:putative endonuclease
MMAFWVYLLRCRDGSYYTGHTDELERRLAQHHAGVFPSCYTANRRPLELVFTQDVASREEALVSERRIKGWSRKKKEAMIAGNWPEVSRLAKSVSTKLPGIVDE